MNYIVVDFEWNQTSYGKGSENRKIPFGHLCFLKTTYPLCRKVGNNQNKHKYDQYSYQLHQTSKRSA